MFTRSPIAAYVSVHSLGMLYRPMVAVVVFALFPACTSTLNSNLNAELALKGPVTLQLQGPVVKYKGTYISKNLMDQVEVNKSTADWVRAVLGEPDVRATLGDGSEIWKWSYSPTEQSIGSLSVFGHSTKDEPKLIPVTAYVRIKQGIVTEKWHE